MNRHKSFAMKEIGKHYDFDSAAAKRKHNAEMEKNRALSAAREHTI